MKKEVGLHGEMELAVCILAFFQRHPHARFNRQALAGILDPADTTRFSPTLERLVMEGLLTKHGGGMLYGLAGTPPTHP